MVLEGYKMESTKLAVDFIKILVTISAGSLILTCNLISQSHSCLVQTSLILFFISMFFCSFMALGRLTGLISEQEAKHATNHKKKVIIGDCLLRTYIIISIISFFLGCVILLIYVW